MTGPRSSGMKGNTMDTIKTDKRFIRHAGLFDVHELAKKKILVVGAGAIGGAAALALTKIGAQDVTVCDFDKVGIENVGPQLFGPRHIGQYKVDVLKGIIEELTGTTIKVDPRRVERLPEAQWDIIILAADSMAVRRWCFESLRYHWLVDGRMGAEELTVYTAVKGSNNYAKTLYSDKDVDPVPCTEKSTSYTALIAGGFIAAQVKQIIHTNKPRLSINLSIKELDMM